MSRLGGARKKFQSFEEEVGKEKSTESAKASDVPKGSGGSSDSTSQSEELSENQLIILEPASKAVDGLVRLFESDGDTDVHRLIHSIPKIKDTVSLIGQVAPCLVIISAQSPTVIQMAVPLLKLLSPMTKSGRVKVLMLSKFKQQALIKKLEKLGVHEYVIEPIAERSLQFKIKLQLRALSVQRKKEEKELELKSKAAQEAENNDNVTIAAEESREEGELQLAEDVWLIRGQRPKKMAGKWVVEMEGPDPNSGDWAYHGEDESGNPLWRWKDDTEEEDGKEESQKDGWIFAGNKPGMFNGKWRFVGKDPDLSFKKSGKKEGSKVKTDKDGVVCLAKDSVRAMANIQKTKDAVAARTAGEKRKKAEEKKTRAESEGEGLNPEKETQSAWNNQVSEGGPGESKSLDDEGFFSKEKGPSGEFKQKESEEAEKKETPFNQGSLEEELKKPKKSKATEEGFDGDTVTKNKEGSPLVLGKKPGGLKKGLLFDEDFEKADENKENGRDSSGSPLVRSKLSKNTEESAGLENDGFFEKSGTPEGEINEKFGEKEAKKRGALRPDQNAKEQDRNNKNSEEELEESIDQFLGKKKFKKKSLNKGPKTSSQLNDLEETEEDGQAGSADPDSQGEEISTEKKNSSVAQNAKPSSITDSESSESQNLNQSPKSKKDGKEKDEPDFNSSNEEGGAYSQAEEDDRDFRSFKLRKSGRSVLDSEDPEDEDLDIDSTKSLKPKKNSKLQRAGPKQEEGSEGDFHRGAGKKLKREALDFTQESNTEEEGPEKVSEDQSADILARDLRGESDLKEQLRGKEALQEEKHNGGLLKPARPLEGEEISEDQKFPLDFFGEGNWEQIPNYGHVFINAAIESATIESIQKLSPFYYIGGMPEFEPFYNKDFGSWIFHHESPPRSQSDFKKLPIEVKDYILSLFEGSDESERKKRVFKSNLKSQEGDVEDEGEESTKELDKDKTRDKRRLGTDLKGSLEFEEDVGSKTEEAKGDESGESKAEKEKRRLGAGLKEKDLLDEKAIEEGEDGLDDGGVELESDKKDWGKRKRQKLKNLDRKNPLEEEATVPESEDEDSEDGGKKREKRMLGEGLERKNLLDTEDDEENSEEHDSKISKKEEIKSARSKGDLKSRLKEKIGIDLEDEIGAEDKIENESDLEERAQRDSEFNQEEREKRKLGTALSRSKALFSAEDLEEENPRVEEKNVPLSDEKEPSDQFNHEPTRSTQKSKGVSRDLSLDENEDDLPHLEHSEEKEKEKEIDRARTLRAKVGKGLLEDEADDEFLEERTAESQRGASRVSPKESIQDDAQKETGSALEESFQEPKTEEIDSHSDHLVEEDFEDKKLSVVGDTVSEVSDHSDSESQNHELKESLREITGSLLKEKKGSVPGLRNRNSLSLLDDEEGESSQDKISERNPSSTDLSEEGGEKTSSSTNASKQSRRHRPSRLNSGSSVGFPATVGEWRGVEDGSYFFLSDEMKLMTFSEIKQVVPFFVVSEGSSVPPNFNESDKIWEFEEGYEPSEYARFENLPDPVKTYLKWIGDLTEERLKEASQEEEERASVPAPSLEEAPPHKSFWGASTSEEPEPAREIEEKAPLQFSSEILEDKGIGDFLSKRRDRDLSSDSWKSKKESSKKSKSNTKKKVKRLKTMEFLLRLSDRMVKRLPLDETFSWISEQITERMGVSRAELIKLIKDQGNRGIQLCGARAFTEELISDEVMEALEASKTQELQTDEGIAAWIPLESSSGVLLGLIKIVKAGSEKLDPAEADFLKRLAKAVSSLVEQFDQVTFKKAS